MLDYFADGYRFGVKPTGYDRTSVEYSKDTDANNLDYFNHSKTFPDGIPYGVFNGVAGDKNLTYDLSEYISDMDVVTVEFIAKIECPYYTYSGFINSTFNAERSHLSLFSYANQILVGHTTYNNYGWTWPAALYPSNPLFTGSDANISTWHRYRLVKYGCLMYCISDINRIIRLTDLVEEDQMKIFNLLNCVVNANNYNEKVGSYCITQLAIYKWVNSLPPTDLNTTLWIDTPECPKEKWSMN